MEDALTKQWIEEGRKLSDKKTKYQEMVKVGEIDIADYYTRILQIDQDLAALDEKYTRYSHYYKNLWKIK